MKWPAAVAFAVATSLAAGAVRAHVVYGTETLHRLVREADFVARARILDPGMEVAHGEPIVVAEVLEVIKGAPVAGPLRFAQHGHGVPTYAKHQEVALFLHRIERSREFGSLAGTVEWVSIQEGKGLAAGAAPLAALRAYAALEKLPPSQQPQGLRQITVKLLASPDPELASSAVRDVALAPDAPIVTAEDLPALEKVLGSESTPTGVRVALLAEVERRKLAEGPPRWVKLLRATRGTDQIAVVRAVAAHPSAAVTHELVTLLASPDLLLVSSAAVSLGVPGNETAVAPLGTLLGASSERVRMAAIRGLGRIGTPSAQARLSQAAASHPDPDTRRRAGAEASHRR